MKPVSCKIQLNTTFILPQHTDMPHYFNSHFTHNSLINPIINHHDCEPCTFGLHTTQQPSTQDLKKRQNDQQVSAN